MSTRARIGLELKDGSILSAYHHWDGYPEHNGTILLNHYNNKDIINTLLNNGNLSILGEQIDPSPDSPHTFTGKRQDTVCVFYFRERNEMGNEKKNVISDIEYKMSINDCDYQYLFDNGQWKYRNGHSGWMELTPKVCTMS